MDSLAIRQTVQDKYEQYLTDARERNNTFLVTTLHKHGLPAEIKDGSILTLNQYMDASGTYHEEPVTVPATFRAVREFLGY